MPVVHLAKGFGQASVELAQEVAQLRNTQGLTDAFFVADMGLVDELVEKWSDALPRVRPFYSVQCNPDQLLLSALAKHPTIGFHCTTRQNTAEVLAAVPTPGRLLYSNPCWTKGALVDATNNGVDFLGFESAKDLRRIYEQAPNANLLLNLCVAPNEEDPSSTFGCDINDSLELLNTARDLGLTVIGVGFNLGLTKNTPLLFQSAIHMASQVFKLGQELGHDLRLLNIGGGFENSSMFETTAAVINEALDESFGYMPYLDVIATPGRFFASSIFSLITNIIERDEVDASHITNDDFDSGKLAYVYRTNEGYYGPFGCKNRNAVPACHALFRSTEEQHDDFFTAVRGTTTDEFDDLLDSCHLRQLSVGDWLLWTNMGAYSLGNKASLDETLAELPIYYVKPKEYWYDNDSGIDNNSAGNSDTESVCSEDEDLSHHIWASWMADFNSRERATNSFSF